MKVIVEHDENKVELLKFGVGETFLRDGDVWLVIDTRVYDEELDDDSRIHAVRLHDGFMDGFNPMCLVTPVTVEAVIKEG